MPALAAIIAEPTVARWWGESAIEDVRSELGTSCVIEVEGEPAGWLLYYEEPDPQYRHVGLDIAITTARQGRGYGPEALRLLIRHFVSAGHHRFTIDPAAANERAIAAYASVGFKPVGRMREYERGLDGTWHDGLLMDLLAGELIG